MKESGEDRLKYAVCESILSTVGAVTLPRVGKAKRRRLRRKKRKANPASLRSAAPSKGRG